MSGDQVDVAAWLDQVARQRAEQYAARQRQRRADRAEFGRRRRAGLARRHARKLRQRGEPADSHGERRTGTDPHSGTPDGRASGTAAARRLESARAR